MIKPKQPLQKIKNINSAIRKPSLPIKRTSSAQSNNFSDHSCMSDRILYKKNINQQKQRQKQKQKSNRMIQANNSYNNNIENSYTPHNIANIKNNMSSNIHQQLYNSYLNSYNIGVNNNINNNYNTHSISHKISANHPNYNNNVHNLSCNQQIQRQSQLNNTFQNQHQNQFQYQAHSQSLYQLNSDPISKTALQKDDINNKQRDMQKQKFLLGSDSSLHKIRNKFSMVSQDKQKQKNKQREKQKQKQKEQQVIKKSQQNLTGFQWLIILRHCFHSKRKQKLSLHIKKSSLINFIRARAYPDSLWSKILVTQNQCKFSTSQIINILQKQTKQKISIDDIFIFICKGYSKHGFGISDLSFINVNKNKNNLHENNSSNNVNSNAVTNINISSIHNANHGAEESQSAAQTARFTENMKNGGLENRQNNVNHAHSHGHIRSNHNSISNTGTNIHKQHHKNDHKNDHNRNYNSLCNQNNVSTNPNINKINQNYQSQPRFIHKNHSNIKHPSLNNKQSDRQKIKQKQVERQKQKSKSKNMFIDKLLIDKHIQKQRLKKQQKAKLDQQNGYQSDKEQTEQKQLLNQEQQQRFKQRYTQITQNPQNTLNVTNMDKQRNKQRQSSLKQLKQKQIQLIKQKSKSKNKYKSIEKVMDDKGLNKIIDKNIDKYIDKDKQLDRNLQRYLNKQKAQLLGEQKQRQAEEASKLYTSIQLSRQSDLQKLQNQKNKNLMTPLYRQQKISTKIKQNGSQIRKQQLKSSIIQVSQSQITYTITQKQTTLHRQIISQTEKTSQQISSNSTTRIPYIESVSINSSNINTNKNISPMNITSINSFPIDERQLGLNISPISVIDQTNNNISFSVEDGDLSLPHNQMQLHPVYTNLYPDNSTYFHKVEKNVINKAQQVVLGQVPQKNTPNININTNSNMKLNIHSNLSPSVSMYTNTQTTPTNTNINSSSNNLNNSKNVNMENNTNTNKYSQNMTNNNISNSVNNIKNSTNSYINTYNQYTSSISTDQSDRFQSSYNGIQEFKKNWQYGPNNTNTSFNNNNNNNKLPQEKISMIYYIDEILNYSVYKYKENGSKVRQFSINCPTTNTCVPSYNASYPYNYNDLNTSNNNNVSTNMEINKNYKPTQKKYSQPTTNINNLQGYQSSPLMLSPNSCTAPSPSSLLNHTNQFFYGLKLQTRKNISKIPEVLLKRIICSGQFIEYFSNLQALKISEYYDQLPIVMPVLLQNYNMRILNLSNNNIGSITFLKQINLARLQFINLSANMITNISQLFNYQYLQEIHVKNNQIDHISCQKQQKAKKLKIIDLAYNRISKQQDLWGLAKLNSLEMINLLGNKIMIGFKSIQLLNPQIIVQHQQMYIFSAYTQYKDLAFEAKNKDRQKLKQKQKQIAQQIQN